MIVNSSVFKCAGALYLFVILDKETFTMHGLVAALEIFLGIDTTDYCIRTAGQICHLLHGQLNKIDGIV